MRMLHELQYWDDASFITLTYDEENLPKNKSLVKKDLQKFIKRLRYTLDTLDKKIKYFACGEYGNPPKTLPNGYQTIGDRPHYHLIIFGLDKSKLTEKLIKKSWDKGKIDVGEAEHDSIRYVAQYIDKKWSGDKAKKEYKEKGRESVFRLLSAGIGKQWCLDNSKQIIDNLEINIKGVKMAVPRYYINLLEVDVQTDELQELKEERERDKNYKDKKIGLSYSNKELIEIYKKGDNKKITDIHIRKAKKNIQRDKELKKFTSMREGKI